MDEEYFEFNEVEEFPAEPDFDNTKNCPHCGKPVPKNSLFCLYCGERISPSSHSPWFILTACVVCIIFIFVLCKMFF